MITVKPLRNEALSVGFVSLSDRLPADFSFDTFCERLKDWRVDAFCDGEKPVGMLMTKENELHVAVLPEVRGKWLSRRLIREVFAPILEQYGQAKTSVAEGNERGHDFVRRIRAGFADLTFDPTTVALQVGGSLLSGAIGADASKSAANTQAEAARHAADTQYQMFKTVNDQQAPWRQAGQNALSTISDMQPQFTHSFGADDLKTNLAPNYQFQLDQGLGAVKNAGNMQSGIISGNTLKGVNDYAQNFAGNAYQQAFNNYNAQQSNIFNRLSNIAGLGQTANQTTATAGTTLAGNIGNAQMAGGQAAASGIVGQANALTGGANNALGWYTLPQLMNYGGTGFAGGSSGGATGGASFAE